MLICMILSLIVFSVVVFLAIRGVCCKESLQTGSGNYKSPYFYIHGKVTKVAPKTHTCLTIQYDGGYDPVEVFCTMNYNQPSQQPPQYPSWLGQVGSYFTVSNKEPISNQVINRDYLELDMGSPTPLEWRGNSGIAMFLYAVGKTKADLMVFFPYRSSLPKNFSKVWIYRGKI